MRKIFISEVLAEVNKPNSVFSIGFWKDDGTYSQKDGIVNRAASLDNRKKMNRNGLLRCATIGSDKVFDLTIDLIVNFNGMQVIRPE